MINVEYANAYSEILEILKYISIDDYNKIPKSKINLFENYANKEYTFKYNPQKTLDEQYISKRAKAIILILFRDYWATDIQRNKMLSNQKSQKEQLEKNKRDLYNPDNLFKKQKNEVLNYANSNTTKETAIIAYKEKSFLQKLFDKIKNLFRKN